MADILVDSNVLLDVLTEDPQWYDWSSSALAQAAGNHVLAINPIIYAEISIGFDRIEELDAALPESMIQRRPIPLEASFLAGKCFVRYRHRGGEKRSPLPDFFIGAHAAVEKMTLLTRDARRYRTYFPTLKIICPFSAPPGG
jgi:predicted nucleic acid-binding protein